MNNEHVYSISIDTCQEASFGFLLPMYDADDTECHAAGYVGPECVLYR